MTGTEPEYTVTVSARTAGGTVAIQVYAWAVADLVGAGVDVARFLGSLTVNVPAAIVRSRKADVEMSVKAGR